LLNQSKTIENTVFDGYLWYNRYKGNNKNEVKALHLEVKMYRNRSHQIFMSDDFFLPFGGTLNKENRWVKLAQIIPWWEFEDRYSKYFKASNRGGEALSVRVALGTLILQAKMGLTDRELVAQIIENPYYQYFLGFEKYEDRKQPFDPSLLVYFRKRLNKDILIEVNEIIAKQSAAQSMPKKKGDDNNSSSGSSDQGDNNIDDNSTQPNEEDADSSENGNRGFLLLDATCAPSDIRYPTDLRLLNEAREKLEKDIDVLHKPDTGIKIKPRTYRENARKDYLAVEKQRKKRSKTIHKAVRKQLGYVGRDLGIIDEYLSQPERLNLLSKRQKSELATIRVLYAQQLQMFESNTHSIENRIVSISQPHVRPIVRGKAGAAVEFGNKVMTSVINGYCFIEKMSFDSFNEGVNLIDSVEGYKERFGYYPEVVLADTIFRNQENRAFLKLKGIRISGPNLGRPNKSKIIERAKKQLEYIDSGLRNGIESSYGVAKRKLGLGLIKAKLKETAESCIVLQFLVMNLERRLRVLLRQFFEDIILEFYNLQILGLVKF
jgi:transposase, IS5 family